MQQGRRIPEATLSRLPLYLRVLEEVQPEAATISSESLAAKAGVNAAQVRKDLSHLGSYGVRGVGYDVGFLLRQISRRLGLDEARRVVIVGAGHLGQALASYGGFPARGFHVVAAFDVDARKVGSAFDATTVRPTSELAAVIAAHAVDIGIITTPASAAQGVADALVDAGISCILNFAPTTLSLPPHVALRQVDLAMELQILSIHQKRLEATALGA